MKQDSEDFNSFWFFWRKTKRHTDGRGKCRKAYQRQLDEGATPEDILLAAQWHVRNCKDLAYIELAASWLNGECWIDEAPQEREYQARLQAKQTAPRENVVSITPARTKSAWLEEFERKRAGIGS